MTPAELEHIQNRMDRGISSSADTLTLLQGYHELLRQNEDLKKKNGELENDLTDLAIDSHVVQTGIQAWEEKFEHMQSSALTASMLLNEAREEIIVLKKSLKLAESRGKKGSCRYPE